jgi:hypothetical protein
MELFLKEPMSLGMEAGPGVCIWGNTKGCFEAEMNAAGVRSNGAVSLL